MIDAAIQRIHGTRGLRAAIARGLGLRDATVGKWKLIPAEHVFRVAAITLIPPEQLRPDMFIHDPLRRHLVDVEVLPNSTGHGQRPKHTAEEHRLLSIARTARWRARRNAALAT